MIRNFFKVTYRNLLRHKGFSTINITGLAIGMATTILILLWIQDEVGYDRFHKNKDRIYEVWNRVPIDGEISTWNTTPVPLAAAIEKDLPEVERAVRVNSNNKYLLSVGEKKMIKSGAIVDTGFLQMFSFRMLQGDPTSALDDAYSVVLTKKTAKALFGNGDALGKIIKIGDKDHFTVAGILEDPPKNTRFNFEYLLPWAYLKYGEGQDLGWYDNSISTYVMLKPHANYASATAKIKALKQRYTDEAREMKWELFIYPLDRWRLYSSFTGGVEDTKGRSTFISLFGIIAGFILLIACINFMNLSTARSEKRSKEVGIRKVMGSVRNQLVGQFLSESLMMVSISFLISIAIVVFCLPLFNEIANKKMTIPWSNSYFIVITLTFIIGTSILAGSYPALFLSSFNPVKVLKGTFKAGRLASLPRKVMVVFQFTISIVLIIGTFVVFQQIQHAKDRPVGFDREGILHIRVHTEDLSKANYNSLRHDLLSTGVVEDMAKSDSPITGGMWADASLTWEGKDPSSQPLVAINTCSHDFPRTNGFQFIEGRDFSREFSTDSSAVIVNEMAAKLFSNESVIGKKIKLGGKEREIVGVIKDQIRWTPFSKQSPHIYFVSYVEIGYLTIRINADAGVRSALDKIEAVIEKYDAAAPFEYKFQDDDYARLFNNEERIGKLASVFATLAIFISCLGIFGLASFTASQRTKEIGIRKVLGATIYSVWKMLSRDFVWLVVLSILIAAPLAYYFSNQWLQQYEYRIEISIWVFLISGAGALVFTLMTVSFQALKAALINPVNSLKSE